MDIKKGERLTKTNIWVKRPGTGEILAVDFNRVLGKCAAYDILVGKFIRKKDINI